MSWEKQHKGVLGGYPSTTTTTTAAAAAAGGGAAVAAVAAAVAVDVLYIPDSFLYLRFDVIPKGLILLNDRNKTRTNQRRRHSFYLNITTNNHQ